MKKTKICLLIILIIFLTVAGVRIYHVNREFPQVETLEISRGETAEISGCEVRLLSLEIDSPESFGVDRKYDDELILAAEIEVLNNTAETVSFPYYKLSAERGAWSNDAAMDIFSKINGFEIGQSEIAPDEKKTVRLGYVMTKTQFASGMWEKINAEDFEITMLDYPKRIVFK